MLLWCLVMFMFNEVSIPSLRLSCVPIFVHFQVAILCFSSFSFLGRVLKPLLHLFFSYKLKRYAGVVFLQRWSFSALASDRF